MLFHMGCTRSGRSAGRAFVFEAEATEDCSVVELTWRGITEREAERARVWSILRFEEERVKSPPISLALFRGRELPGVPTDPLLKLKKGDWVRVLVELPEERSFHLGFMCER